MKSGKPGFDFRKEIWFYTFGKRNSNIIFIFIKEITYVLLLTTVSPKATID